MKKLRLELMVKIAREKIKLRFVCHIGKQRTAAAKNFASGFLRHDLRRYRFLWPPDLWSAVPMNNLWYHDKPHVWPALIRSEMIQDRDFKKLYC